MNLKNTKDIFVGAVKTFAGIIAVGAMIMMITFTLFAESVVFSKEVFAPVLSLAIIFTGIGGLVAVVFIFFRYYIRKSEQQEETIKSYKSTIKQLRKELNAANKFIQENLPPQRIQSDSPENERRDGFFRQIAGLSATESNSEDPCTEDDSLQDPSTDEEI